MPYLRYLFCDECGFPANLDVDYVGTINSYAADGRKSAIIDDRELVWDYMIYSCGACRRSYRFTFLDVELRVRKFLSAQSTKQKFRIDEVAENQLSQQERLNGNYFVHRSIETSKRLKEMYSK